MHAIRLQMIVFGSDAPSSMIQKVLVKIYGSDVVKYVEVAKLTRYVYYFNSEKDAIEMADEKTWVEHGKRGQVFLAQVTYA